MHKGAMEEFKVFNTTSRRGQATSNYSCWRRNLQPRDLLARERARLIVEHRLLDLLARVHHERAVLHDRLADRLACEHEDARAFLARFDADGVSVGKESCRSIFQRFF